MISGFATAVGTLRYAKRHGHLQYQPLGCTGLVVSQAGFGSYRVHDSVPAHREALRLALRAGINIIDTSANYTDGGSERLIGQVIAELVQQQDVQRDELIIVSKGGYLQGENYRVSQQRQAAGTPFPDLVMYADQLEHCIHPDFLAEQITNSLARLGVERLDCYLLHNPEYYLKWAAEQQIALPDARREYQRRILAAFQHLEQECARGRLGCYGISSNTFVQPRTSYTFTSLAAIWELAQSLSPDHHFRVIECPANLFETAAITEDNQAEGQSLLAFAQEKALAVLINRPLNAIQADRLIRLDETVYQGQAAEQALAFKQTIAAITADWHDAPSLRHLALRALRSSRGIASVLVGMRKTEYVADVVEELQRSCQVVERRQEWEAVRTRTET